MNMTNSPVFFGEWVKQRRKILDLTQSELAQNTGCSVFALRKIESGERRPSKQLAELLAQSLEIPSDEKPIFIRVARGERNLERLRTSSHDLSLASIPDLKHVSPSSNIPFQPTQLIGREDELAAMEKLFSDYQCRLLTLTGMGGIGKTHLAIEFVTRQCSTFQGCVFFVPLAPIVAVDAIVPAIADAIGFQFSGPGDPKEQLIDYLQSQLQQPGLLILDNLEHLLQQSPGSEKLNAVQLVSEFLERLPNLNILATSRERLNLRGEWTYELHGLPVPPVDFPGQLDDYSALAMFILSAQRAKSDFNISPQEQPAVIKICHLLDGIPLAIELAAAWVGVLTCQEIAQEIGLNIDFLSSSMRDIPERHRSIRASFDHSWKLLSVAEQDVLRKLSVFQGGFDRAAAEQVAEASLPLIASLASKSLVRRMEDGRYDLHEVIRQYALSRLGSGEFAKVTRDRHCSYYLMFVADRENALKSPAQQQILSELSTELDNIRAAWAFTLEDGEYTRLGPALRGLGWFFESAGLLGEGIDLFESLVQILKGQTQSQVVLRVLAPALMQQGLLYFRKGEFTRARQLWEVSIDLLRPIGDQSLMIDALVFLSIILHLDGEYDRARVTLSEALACAQAIKHQWFEAYARYNIGYVDSLMGCYHEGYEKMMTGLEMWRRIGDPHYIALGLNYLVTTLIKLERYDEAISFMRESIDLCAQSKNRWGMGTAYRYYGLATLAQGDFSNAQVLFHKSLEVFGDYYIGWDIARTLSYLGEATMLAGDLSEARKIFQKSLRLSLQANAVPIALDSLLGLAQIMAQDGETSSALRISNCVQSHSSSAQETKESAAQFIDMLKKTNIPESIEDSLFLQSTNNFDEIVDELLTSVEASG
jgi:predicted ATPase/transcriptional regulator with XRE-family HTH domain